MLDNKIIIEFEQKKHDLKDYVNSNAFESFKTFIKNYMIEKVNSGDYQAFETSKNILEHLYYLERGKKSGL